MNGVRRFVKCLASLEETARLPVYCKLVRPFDDETERVMSGVTVPGARGAGLAVKDTDAHFPSRQVGQRLNKRWSRTAGCRLCLRRHDKFGRAPGCKR